jgi:DNA-binding winged helix-turn-helix (wHTH) protein/tetratricopeptide (TPR) repeat protein
MRRSSSATPGSKDTDSPAAGSARNGEYHATGFVFAGFRLEADGTLLRGKTAIPLPPKELAALRLLLAHAGQVVSPAQLREALWGDVHVTADSVAKCLSSLRARLEPEACIQTVYKRGYRFSAEVCAGADAAAGALPRLAMMPFVAEFGVPEHLGSAIAEETMARMSAVRHPAISLLAQDSIFTLARRGFSALEVGVTHNADIVLAGTLRALPAHYRLRAEMIRVADGTQLWVEDVLVERSRIAGLELELVNRLLFRLNAGGLSLAASAEPAPTDHNDSSRREAYEAFQRAHHEWQTLERHRMQDGLQHLLRAVELDPSLTAARVDLVNLSVTQAFYGYMSPAVSAELVRQSAESVASATGFALGAVEQLQQFSGPAEAMLPAIGWVSFHVDRDLPRALLAFSLSAHLPHDPWTTRARVMLALSRHRFAEAIEMLRTTIRLDPFSPWLHARLAWALHLDGQTAASVECLRHAIAQFAGHEGVKLYGAMILAFNGEAAQAIELASELAQRLPYFDLATAVHAYALACAGRRDEGRTILERLQWLSRERFVLNSFNPAVHLALGDPDAALAELRASAESRCPWFFQMLADPRLEPLRGRPEFEAMRQILAAMEADAARRQDLDD